MRSIEFLLGLALCLGSCTRGIPSKTFQNNSVLPLQDQILQVMNHPETKFFYSTDKIPKRLLAKAKAVSKKEGLEHDGVYKVAEPGAPYRHGCLIEDGLLSRRMIFLARLNNIDVLCYERGGRSHRLLISYAERKKNKLDYFNLSINGILDCSEYSNQDKIKEALRESNIHLHYDNGKPLKHHTVPF